MEDSEVNLIPEEQKPKTAQPDTEESSFKDAQTPISPPKPYSPALNQEDSTEDSTTDRINQEIASISQDKETASLPEDQEKKTLLEDKEKGFLPEDQELPSIPEETSQAPTPPLSQEPDLTVSQPIPPVKKPSKLPKILRYVIIFLFLISFGAFGFWSYQKKTVKESPLPLPTPSLLPTAVPTEKPEAPIATESAIYTSEEVAGWQTYQDAIWRISFQYPAAAYQETYKKKVKTPDPKFPEVISSIEFTLQASIISGSKKGTVQWWLYDNAEKLSLSDFFEQYAYSPETCQIDKDFKIGSQNAIKTTCSFPEYPNAITVFLTNQQNKIYEVSYEYNDNEDYLIPVIEKSLQTIKVE